MSYLYTVLEELREENGGKAPSAKQLAEATCLDLKEAKALLKELLENEPVYRPEEPEAKKRKTNANKAKAKAKAIPADGSEGLPEVSAAPAEAELVRPTDQSAEETQVVDDAILEQSVEDQLVKGASKRPCLFEIYMFPHSLTHCVFLESCICHFNHLLFFFRFHPAQVHWHFAAWPRDASWHFQEYTVQVSDEECFSSIPKHHKKAQS